LLVFKRSLMERAGWYAVRPRQRFDGLDILLAGGANTLMPCRSLSAQAYGHANECYHGIEQIGWNEVSKPRGLRATLGLSTHWTCKPLRQAVSFLKSHGVTLLDALPPELLPGMDDVAYALDPDGHCIQFYYFIEPLGWDGEPWPQSQRRQVNGEWPETLEPPSDTDVDQDYQGPPG
jgi:hypothetical protein